MLTDTAANGPAPSIHIGELAGKSTRDAILSELDRVCRTVLQKKKALRKMLQFVVEATLNGKGASLKEYTIGTLVFGKGGDFDPRMTSLVRTQAHKLRQVLLAYYCVQPSYTGPWLWIPPGSYQAVFDRNPAQNLHANILEAPSGWLPVMSPRCLVSQPTVLARGSDLTSVASEVVRLQREHLGWDRSGSTMPEPMRRFYDGMGAEAGPPCEFAVKHTIVELDDSLLVTAYLLAGKERSVFFGRSFSVAWAGNPVASLSQIAPELSAFTSSVGLIIKALEKP